MAVAEKKDLFFGIDEYQERLAKLRTEMEARGLEVLLIHTPENIYYLSGYQTPGYYTYQCAIVPLDGDPIMFTRYLEETNVRGLSWIDTRDYYLDTQDPVAETCRTLRDHGLADKKIGVEESSWFLTIADYHKLREGLPGATLSDASGAVEQLRLVKSPQEIAYIRQAAAACDEGMRRAIETAGAGKTEDDLALALYAGALAHGSEYMSLPPFVASGYRSALAHATWSGRELEAGDVVFLEHAGVIHRYSASLIRVLSVGEPSDQVKRMDEAARAGLRGALTTAAPGVPAFEVDRACRGAIRDLGFGDYFRHRTGYSIGINFPPDWGEGHIMSIKETETRPLEPGMTFHIVPGLFDYGHAAVGCSQTILITDDGCEPLSAIPEQLFVVRLQAKGHSAEAAFAMERQGGRHVNSKTSAVLDDLCEQLFQRRISRREFNKRLTALGISAPVIAAAAASAPGPVAAQDKPFSGQTLRVQFWSGPEGDNIQRNVVDPFVEETGAEVIVEYGFTSGSIAKVRAQAADPQLDVFLMDDIGVLTVAPENLLQTLNLENIPNAANVDPRFIVADGQGIGFFTYVDTLLYNTNAYESPPTSWGDLWAEDLVSKASVPTSNQTPALHMIIAAAILGGGDQMNPDPGFALLEELRPNVRILAENVSQIAELMNGGDVELLSWTSYIFREYMEQGYPIENTFALEEGVFATPACACIPEGHPGSQELAEAFVNKCLEPAAQEGMAEGLWFGPTNSEAVIPEETAKRVITFAELDNTIPVDLEHLLGVRQDWITRYERALVG